MARTTIPNQVTQTLGAALGLAVELTWLTSAKADIYTDSWLIYHAVVNDCPSCLSLCQCGVYRCVRNKEHQLYFAHLHQYISPPLSHSLYPTGYLIKVYCFCNNSNTDRRNTYDNGGRLHFSHKAHSEIIKALFKYFKHWTNMSFWLCSVVSLSQAYSYFEIEKCLLLFF